MELFRVDGKGIKRSDLCSELLCKANIFRKAAVRLGSIICRLNKKRRERSVECLGYFGSRSDDTRIRRRTGQAYKYFFLALHSSTSFLPQL